MFIKLITNQQIVAGRPAQGRLALGVQLALGVHLLRGRRQGEQEGEQLADKLLALGVLLELGVVLQYGAHQVQHA